MKTDENAKPLVWGLIALWAIVSFMGIYTPEIISPNNARFVNVAILCLFTFFHGAERYGMRGIVVYFVIAVVVTNITENMSIMTGFPFGPYHHTDAMGPKIWHVPIIVGPIFAVAGYLSWVLAGILLGDVFVSRPNAIALARPIIAAFITTSWDLCVDAIGATVNRDWVWANGGPWFGVPWLNFFGWMLTMWLIFQAFAWYLSRTTAPREIPAASHYWTQVVLYWFLIALQFPLLTTLGLNGELNDPTRKIWELSDLLQSMALVSVFTMLFTCILAYAILVRARESSAGHS